ncbi:Rieske (2Fe-2S) protein [bacterium]|nr:Rieske (2Fe-2S) protein [bacterium]
MVNRDQSASAFPLRVDAERRLDRRRFLGVAGCAALLVAGGEWLARRGEQAASTPLTLAPIDTAGLAAGEARAVDAREGGQALVVRLSADEVVAFDRRCPHLGCPVVWSAANGRFECPCHHAAFDARSGRVLFGPPRRGLTAAVLAPV